MYNHNSGNNSASSTWGFVVLCAALAVAAGSASAAPIETVLHSFTGSDGANPQAGLIADSAGNLYGTTEFGGASGNGVVFKLSSSGTYTVLHSFTGSDGANPFAGLIADSSGNLYGTTNGGGNPAINAGVVFELSPSGTYTVLHSFCSSTGCSDGTSSQAGLIADSSGNLYGTTPGGGVPGTCSSSGCGVVFELSPSGTYAVLHSFTGSFDGAIPAAGLIADSNRNLYGTTEFTAGVGTGNGVVFKLSSSGTYTVLHSFTGSDGANPFAGLLADSSGNLYGTTGYGGASNDGVVFKLSPGGSETVLYSFAGTDGIRPAAGLIADRNGNLYGTTSSGGASGNGVVFKLSPSGTYTVLYSFTGSDGSDPEQAALIADSTGNLYGTTKFGGASGNGVVFKLAGTGFVTAIPALQVTPATAIVAAAAQGGRTIFSPASFDYQLAAANGSVNVSMSGMPSWLNASFTSATVTTATPLTVTFSLNNLGTLARGTYNATIAFTNSTNGQGDTTRTATLRIYNKDDCKNGGWRNFISPPGPFQDQGTCVTYFATH
jgi:uncharacterized repeat protein (TIGR03803 family)